MNKPLRILHIVTTMNRGGLETMLMNYYRQMDRNKIQFDFLVHRNEKSAYEDEILDLGGRIYRLPKLNPFNLHYRKQLNLFFAEHPEYQVVHVHQDCLSSIALKAAYKNQVPVRIAHSHNSSQDKDIKYLIKRIYMRNIPKYATDLFACGKEAGDWMFGGEKYEILNNAIDAKQFKCNQSIRENVRKSFDIENNFIVGHVGRFNYPKNHDFLIDIFNEVYQFNPNAKLMLVGSGELEQKIRDKVDKLGLTDHVLFLGSRSNVNELMQAMDVFVFPSHYEGLPVTLVEAQASGLPIFKSDNVPNQCQITPNVYSLPLDVSAKEWAEKIIDRSKGFIRENTFDDILKAGYDIKANAKWLEEFYIAKCESIFKI